jgi:hypothetical protein
MESCPRGSIFSAMPRCMHTRLGRAGPNALLAAALIAGAALAACAGADTNPPDAEFLVATADSAFWVRSDSQGIQVRAVPMTITRFDGRFREVFVANLDRSFDDAVFTGERVYVRDLQTNDSTLVYDDTAIVAMAARHARAYPDANPLGPDDDTPDDPQISATGETDVLEVRGGYALLEHRSAYEMPAGSQHDTVHAAVDLRTGTAATQSEMSRDSVADDSNVVRTVPVSWTRKGYMVQVRGAGEGAVSISLRDDARHVWPLFSVGAHPRFYWLDHPAVGRAQRRALVRAFNSAAAYDETVKYVKYVVPAARKSVRHAIHRA